MSGDWLLFAHQRNKRHSLAYNSPLQHPATLFDRWYHFELDFGGLVSCCLKHVEPLPPSLKSTVCETWRETLKSLGIILQRSRNDR